jgi:hypothetical protein
MFSRYRHVGNQSTCHYASYHYFLSSSTINCVNLRSDPEFKLIFTDVVLDLESITQHPDNKNIICLALKISRKKLVRVYNAHGLLKKIAVGNVRIKYQSYIFFSPLSMFPDSKFLHKQCYFRISVIF